MVKSQPMRYALVSIRDFCLAMAGFVGFAYILVADQTYIFPPGALDMASSARLSPSAAGIRAWSDLEAVAGGESVRLVSTEPMVLVTCAVVFSAIVALNVAIIRHLRRVHASSRRGAWRGS